MAIVLYGASGFLGRIVAAELVRLGAAFVMAGRDARKMEALSAAFPGVECRVVDASDGSALAALFEGRRVVLNCAPPACGEALIEAAIDAGIHYGDGAGEQHFIQRVFDVHGARAAARGVALVPALGFDYAIGDCLAALAAAGAAADEITVAYAIRGAGIAGNSAANAAAVGSRELVYRQGRRRPLPFEIDRARDVAFPPPFGVQRMARYGSGEVITVPSHVAVRTMTTLIMAEALSPWPSLVPLLPFLRPIVSAVRTSPLRRVLALLSGRDAGRPPTDEERRRIVFSVVVEARGAVTRRGVATGCDNHQVSGAGIALGGLWLSDPSYSRTGALAPAAAFPPARLLESLAVHGLSYDVV